MGAEWLNEVGAEWLNEVGSTQGHRCTLALCWRSELSGQERCLPTHTLRRAFISTISVWVGTAASLCPAVPCIGVFSLQSNTISLAMQACLALWQQLSFGHSLCPKRYFPVLPQPYSPRRLRKTSSCRCSLGTSADAPLGTALNLEPSLGQSSSTT